ncbi:hypothetical protein L5515_017330 [Caenorhabditis briggsae]|uniref:Uncharacterized protein n=1 Tax=Caenorhabditis briggsae TaxID=6238 RepID=A0AAE9F947_CAEBR|nr:hypothetical protein L5515_017330 [Caenorhabditis briggsae]
MASRKNKPIVQVQGYAMRFKKMNKNGTELFYCVERERRARCDAAYLFDRRNNTFTVKKQHAFLVRQELKKCSNDGKPREVVDDVRAKFSVVASVACGSYDAKRKIIDTAKGRKEDDVIEMDKGGSIANEFSQTKAVLYISRYLTLPRLNLSEKMIRLIFLLSLSAAPSFGISCYGYNDYQEVVETLHHRKFCIAVYEVSDGTGAFGGGERHPSRIPNIVNMTKGNDCVMQHVQSNLGIPSSDMWLCYCYTEMCNYPFTWKEFVSRGYTLKPTYAAGFEKK